MTWSEDDDSDKEDETGEGKFSPRAYHLLVAIDTEKSMFEINKDGKSQFINSLEACYQLADFLVLNSRTTKGPLAIVFTNNDLTKTNVFDFNTSLLEAVKLLKKLKRSSNEQLKTKFLRPDGLELADFFLHCKKIFADIKDNSYKNIVYITNDDDPIQENDARKKFNACEQWRQQGDKRIHLTLLTFKSDFDLSIIYSDILAAVNKKEVVHVTGVDDVVKQISPLINERVLKHSMPLYPFSNVFDSCINLVVYRPIRKTDLVTNMYVTKDTQKEVKRKRFKTDGTAVGEDGTAAEEDGTAAEEAETIDQSLEYKCILQKDRQLRFTLDSCEKRAFGEIGKLPIGLHLIAVDNEKYDMHWLSESPQLIEPQLNEAQSCDDFNDLWEYCNEKSKALICIRKYRKGSPMTYVQLVPRYMNNSRMFLMRPLPFGTENVYSPKTELSHVKIEQEKIDVMSALVNKMTVTYNPRDYEDPVEGKRRAYLKSRLLNEPLQPVKTGIPEASEIDLIIGKEVEALQQLGLEDPEKKAKKQPKKRETKATTSKRQKKE